MQESHTGYFAGQLVTVRDERWTVVRAESFQSTQVLSLRGIDLGNRDDLRAVVCPFDVVEPNTASRLRHRSRRATLQTAMAALGRAVPWHESWSAGNARIDLHEWQIEPALAAVTGTMRLLLADGVGLGKTIQSGLVVAELFARGLGSRALILTPASIREQWADELRSRFRLPATVFDQSALARVAAELPPDVNPWSVSSVIVSSIDLVKRAEVRLALDSVAFDVLVVDEAHHLTRGSDRSAVIADLASRTPWVVLATATPHSGDEEAYHFITSVGRVGADDMRIFRRAAARRGAAFRSTRQLRVTPTPDERALLNATNEYLAQLRSQRDIPAARLVGALIARRASSSAAAVLRTLVRRAHLLRFRSPSSQQILLPWEEAEAGSDEVDDTLLSASGLDDVDREIAWLETLGRLAQAAAARSSKAGAVIRLLRRTREQLLVFSEFRDVVVDLASALASTTTTAMLHGGMSQRERRAAIHAFTSGTIRTLLATDAAGEGLNLHAHCRMVINIELPWMPARLEQRIGRVDRMGQTRRVHAIHLVHRDSFESTVIARLERRRARAAAQLATTPEAADTRMCSQATARRRWQETHAGDTRAGAVYATRAMSGDHGDRTRSMVTLLFELPLLDAGGGLLQREAVALRVTLPGVRHLSRQLVRRIVATDSLHATLATVIAQQAVSTAAGMHEISAAFDARLGSLLQRLERTGKTGVQGTLFERRQEQAAQRHATAVQALVSHLSRRREAARRLRRVIPGEPQLVAAWLDRA